MSNFSIYFPMGVGHITDPSAFDHILFIAALCLRYSWNNWKQLLVLVTAFTIGHSITLILSTLNVISVSRDWTEFLIAVTIIVTALNNLYVKDFHFNKKYPLIYFYALFFGLVHGLGFSTLLKSMLGKDDSVVVQLFAFNLGIEAGQLIVVALLLLLSFFILDVFKLNRRKYVIVSSAAISVFAAGIAIQRWPL